MRIIQLIQKPQARGAEIFASWLCEELKQLGHQVLLVSLFEGDFELPFSGDQLHLHRSKNNRFWDYAAWNRFNEVIKEFKPEIIQANGADTLKFAVFTKKIFRGSYKLIFNNGGIVSTYISSWGHQVFNRFLFKNMNALVSVSDHTKKDLDSFIGFSKIHWVIPTGIQTPFFDQLAKPTRYPVLVHIAGFTDEKNHRGLLRIYEKFHLSHPQSQLWLIGDGPTKASLENEVQQLSFNESIKFLGALITPFNWIPSNAILVLPSLSEGLPAVIMEAFYARIPVVAYAVGGIPELINDGENGFLIEKGKEDHFYYGLERCLQLDALKKAKVLDQAQNLIKENYTIGQMTERYLDLYEELCESSN